MEHLTAYIEATERKAESMAIDDIIGPFQAAGWPSIPVELLAAHARAQRRALEARDEAAVFLAHLADTVRHSQSAP